MCLSAIVTKGMQIGTYGLEQELELETIEHFTSPSRKGIIK